VCIYGGITLINNYIGKLLRDKSKVHGSVLIGVLGVLWIISTIFSYAVLRQPVQQEEVSYRNQIAQQADFKYKVEASPSILYPQGGLVPPREVIATKITNKILIDFKLNISSDHEVNIEGSLNPTMKLIAEEMWEKEYPLGGSIPLQRQGITSEEVNQSFEIVLPEILKTIEEIEEEIIIRPGSYRIEILPNIKGNISGAKGDMELDSSPILSFELSDSKMKLSSEQNYKKDSIIELKESKTQYLDPARRNVPISLARYVFISLWIILSVILVLMFTRYIHRPREILEYEIIDRKYRNRIVEVDEINDELLRNKLSLRSFSRLLQIADEIEKPILRMEEANQITYYVLDQGPVYSYGVKNSPRQSADAQENII